MACNPEVTQPPYYRHQEAGRQSVPDASGCRDSSLNNVCLSFRMTVFHTGNPYWSLSDQISEIIEVLVAEGTSSHCLYETVHTLYPPAADVEGGP